MATFSGEEAIAQIFMIIRNNFLRTNAIKLNGDIITPGTDGKVNIEPKASDIEYVKTVEETDITNVAEALDKIFEDLSPVTAADISYDNSESGLSATTVQEAIDELKALYDSLQATA